MFLYCCVIIFLAVAIHFILQRVTGRKNGAFKRVLSMISCTYFLLVISYFLFDQLFAISNLQDLHAFSIHGFYLFSIWFLLMLLLCAVFLTICILRIHPQNGVARFRITKRQEKCIAPYGMILLAVFGVAFSLHYHTSHSLTISEICSDQILLPDRTEKKEYIEIYNPTRFPVLLQNYFLTDDPENTSHCYPIPETVVPAQGYVIVELEGNGHFSIRKDGESLYLLYGDDHQVIDQVLAKDLPESKGYTNWVFAKNQETGSWEIQNASPFAKNIAAMKKNPVLPQFSAESGFYDTAFNLTLSAPEGYAIYYTLDSSSPTSQSLLYSDAIRVANPSDNPNVYLATPNIVPDWLNAKHNTQKVDKAFVVRAITIDSEGRQSDVVSKTFFVDLEHHHTDYVLSVVTDYEHLIGENGICVTGKAYDEWYLNGSVGEQPLPRYEYRGRMAEVPCNIELLFEQEVLLNTACGLRIQGGYNRFLPMKRLRFIARDVYSGNRYFDFDLFEKPTHSFYARAGFADIIGQQLLMDTQVAGADAKRAHVFVNGEYWYSRYFREQYDEDWIGHKFDVNPDDVFILSAMPGEIQYFVKTHDMSDRNSYKALNEMVDIQNFITYSAANIFYNNTDVSEIKNIRVWKTNSESDQYRFLLYDLDYLEWVNPSFYGTEHYKVNTFTSPFMFADNPYVEGTVFWELKKNDQFCKDFVLTFMDMVNTYFQKERIANMLAEWEQDLSWNAGFFEKRAEYIVPYMAEAFHLNGSMEQITLAVNDSAAGDIKINSVIPELIDGQWCGDYFTDYPVCITAQPKKGYVFVGWHHQGQCYEELSQEITLTDGDNLWEAIFRRVVD